jgi:hypothetical protein
MNSIDTIHARIPRLHKVVSVLANVSGGECENHDVDPRHGFPLLYVNSNGALLNSGSIFSYN